MNRIDRLAAILIQLQTKRLIKAQDIADRFTVSLRTVYRDISALEEAGVPVLGEAGVGYRLMEGYKLPPVMFTEDEASAMLTASKLMQSMSDQNLSRHYTAALDKVRAVLRHSQKDYLEGIDDHIAVISHPAIVYQKPSELHLQTILKAVAQGNVVEMSYTSIEKGETLLRQAEPVGIFLQGSHWYLIAFCRLRNDYRNFRTDQINYLKITDQKMRSDHPPLQLFLDRISECGKAHKVVIEVDKKVMKFFGEQKYYNGFLKQSEIGDHVQMTFLTGSLTGFARWFMVFGDNARIIEPIKLQDLVTDLAAKILKKLEENQMMLT